MPNKNTEAILSSGLFFDQMDFFDPLSAQKSAVDAVADEEEEEKKKKNHRRTVEVLQLDEKFLYRRAFGEDELLQKMGNVEQPLLDGHSYHILTGGLVDALSFLKVVLLHCQRVEYMFISSWVIGGQDLRWIDERMEDGTIGRLDIYVGEIYENQYKVEWRMLKAMHEKYPRRFRRLVQFRNHAKICAGYVGDFYFVIECSANWNMNPRNEHAIITISRDLFLFVHRYFEGIAVQLEIIQAANDFKKLTIKEPCVG